MLEPTAATTLPVLQSQRRSYCACCAAVMSKCPPSSPCEAVEQASPERVTIEIADPHESRTQPSHLISRCRSMRVDAASRCPPSATLVSLCRSSQPWPAYSCSSLQQLSVLPHPAASTCPTRKMHQLIAPEGLPTVYEPSSS